MSQNLRVTKTHIVLELVSDLGRKYEVGYPIEDGYTEESVIKNIKSVGDYKELAGAFLEVNWVPGAPQTSPSRAVVERGIEAGYVSHDRGKIYEYRISFKNTKGWRFYFKDKTGDVYFCSTVLNGWHYIDFNSEDATIVAIR